MITINATGDTTLHTAGKYCPEDILVKVPAGSGDGSGGASVKTCTLRVLNSDGLFYITTLMYEAQENGSRILKIVRDDVTISGYDFTFTDAICDGLVIISGWGYRDTWWTTEGASTVFTSSFTDTKIFRIDSNVAEQATIDLLGDD